MALTEDMKKAFDIHVADLPENSIYVDDESIKVEGGVIRTPRKKRPKEQTVVTPQQTIKREPKVEQPAITLVFNSPVGDISGQYYPVIVSGKYIILGLTGQSYVPATFEENPELKLKVCINDIVHTCVYIGCRWSDPDTHKETIILMEV